MAKEILAIPEEALGEVIRVIRMGLEVADVSDDTRTALTLWCDDEEEYVARL